MTRILHVATVMGSGGLEKWLVDLVAEMEGSSYESHILVQSGQVGLHGERAKNLGLSVLTVPDGHHPLQFSVQFMKLLRKRGPFDVVHSHVHNFSGLVLTLARFAGVPVRIAHAHNDTSREGGGSIRKAYRWLSRRLISSSATHGYGVSRDAAVDLFGGEFGRDPRWEVLPCGISLEPFRIAYDRAELRRDVGLPLEAFVMVQVGRLASFKNQEFSIRLLAELDIPDAVLLLVGDGELEHRCRRLAGDLNVSERVIFAGARPDISRVLSASDLFLFPSTPGEGAPIALIEAQAAGLRCLVSEHIPETSMVVRELVRRISIEGTMDPWKQAIGQVYNSRASTDKEAALESIERSPFSIEANHTELSRIYKPRVGMPAVS